MVALGATVQVSLPPPKRFDRPRLIVPATAVSDILGKKAARAAPILALAARSRLSASAMSGRRNNIVESRFPGNCAIVEPFGDSPVGNSSAGTVAPTSKLRRSEEHTSELQSLMRSSYAVFCLKKNKHKTK